MKQAVDWCEAKSNTSYCETSAKEDANINLAFQTMAKNALGIKE